MSREINQFWQCKFCSALFLSDDLLQLHIEEYRSRAAEAENCRAHVNANADESSEDRLDDNEELGMIKRNTQCPYKGCNRNDPFQKGQQLRVHYRRHVACEEVCVYCYKVFRAASEYIRHTRDHNDAVAEKEAYTSRRCTRLLEQTNRELMEQLRTGDHSRIKKRKWTEAALHSDVTGREPKCEEIGVFEDVPSDPVAARTMPALESAHGVTIQGDLPQNLVNLHPQTDLFLPTQEDDELYTPSLFLRMNFCAFPPSAELGLGLDTVTGIDTMGL
ncbi:hypothetical protein CLIM01_14892 [Colletotrichum limetticola]|uniref:C2H2-type domain-containing protein n=1 Tax=Colletotrichum limetticola TaxID=1209924 RepID=A0ABQ9P6T7_9PEZI|nr:hypothetical protein CLIM01_14892 [Colletotrichum limetticola]